MVLVTVHNYNAKLVKSFLLQRMRAIIYGGLRYVQQSGYRLGTIAQIGNGCGNGCVIYLIFFSFFFCR